MRRVALAVFLLLCAAPPCAHAEWDLSLFVGQAFPTYDERLVVRLPAVPPAPGLDIQASGTPELRADGGPVFGAALAREFGVLAIEFRLDVTEVALELEGVRYDLRATPPVFGLSRGSITVGDTRLDAEQLQLVSINARLRTPGPISVVASGGLSYLPDLEIGGSIPVTFTVEGLGTSLAQPRLLISAQPNQSNDRWGVNGGAGLRLGGRVAAFAEARVFYFGEYDLNVAFDDAQPLVNALLEQIEPVRFRPVIFNAVAGLVFRF
jgi:hypothetical protein